MQNGLWQFLSPPAPQEGDLQKPPKICKYSNRLIDYGFRDSARTDEPSPDDEKRRNYGGVYVGLPSDMTTVAASQSKSTDKN
ncbi:hypothetical protein J4Q44_G00117130 [Coregonus suidteri]|uniref:Uncharacterized protein n=1 Tax=Coregonus suidteri TaxID=861788 RepID=A0AAN8LZQ8_9TELE